MTVADRPTRARLDWLAPLVAVLVGLFAWRGALGWSLLGWDSYPMIWAGRVTDVASFFGTFTEELMDGRYPLGHFWRPVVHFAFALDHALWGLDPFGYHLSDLLVLVASAALVACLTQRLVGCGGLPLAGIAAGLVFALHPLHFEVLPVAPRRADGLAVLFTLVALYVQLGRLEREAGPRRLSALALGLACALALGSKETGAIAPAAVVLLTLCLPPAPDQGRVSRLLKTAWPAAVGFAAAFALRWVALGGLGGGNESSLTGGFSRAGELVAVFARALYLPDAVFGLDPEATGPVWGVLAGSAALAGWFALRGGARVRGAVAFVALWALALIPLTGMSELPQGWYAFPYMPVFALGVGVAVGAGYRALSCGRRVDTLLGWGAGAALVAFTTLASPLFDDADDFRRASAHQTEFLERFARRLDAAQPGRTLTVQNAPVALRAERLVYIAASYSLEAWADLRYGEGRVRVNMPGLPPSRRAPGPEVIDAVVYPPPSGYVD